MQPISTKYLYRLQELAGIEENYMADDSKISDIANKVAEKSGYHNQRPLKLIGKGYHSLAFELGDDAVLKISRDLHEAVNNNKLIGEKLKYVANVYWVCVIKDKTTPSLNLYAIVQEKVGKPKNIDNLWKEITNAASYSKLGLYGSIKNGTGLLTKTNEPIPISE